MGLVESSKKGRETKKTKQTGKPNRFRRADGN